MVTKEDILAILRMNLIPVLIKDKEIVLPPNDTTIDIAGMHEAASEIVALFKSP